MPYGSRSDLELAAEYADWSISAGPTPTLLNVPQHFEKHEKVLFNTRSCNLRSGSSMFFQNLCVF